jgi:hypothetical protein
MAYSLAQSFFVDRIGGCYATRIDLYFQSKDSSFPVTVQLHEMQNGIPTQKVLPFSRSTLYPEEVFTSEDALAATSFWFESPVFLQGETDYAVVIIPGSDSPNYNVWTARLGDTVIGSDRIISKQAGVGVLFISSDGRTFTPFQEYDLKYTLKTANFDTLGTIQFTNGDTDWITVANTSGRFIQGENVSANLTSNLVSSNTNYGNTAGSGIFEDYYEGAATSIVLNPVNEPFTAGSYIRGEESGATGLIVSIDDIVVDSSFLKSEQLEQIGADFSVSLRGRNTAGVLDPLAKEVDLNDTINFVAPKKIYSYSNEQANFGGSKTSVATITLTSTQQNVSCAFDDDKFSSYQITNLVNADVTGEDGVSGGNALAKYITRRVTLEDGLDAEDMNVYLDAYKPAGSELYVYYKIHNSSDDETFEEKNWKLMTQETSQDTYSISGNFDDQKEYKYVIPTADRTGDSGEVQYTNNAGATFTGYLTFSVKIVITASVSSDVPRIGDVRVIALQI